MRKCYIHNGVVINVGDWDYRPEAVEREEFQQDREGIFAFVTVTDRVPSNPLPLGAEEAYLDLSWTADGRIVPSTDIDAVRPF